MALRTFERLEDMSPDGTLRLHIADDGDIIVAVASDDKFARVEFCNLGSGGGQSPRTFAALQALAKAMQADNEDRSCNARRGLRGVGIDAV
jgi:hypothetical protein